MVYIVPTMNRNHQQQQKKINYGMAIDVDRLFGWASRDQGYFIS